MKIIDTHCHVYTEEFDADREATIERALQAGVGKFFLPNIDEASIAPMLALCEKRPELFRPMMGLHPTELPDDPAPVLDRMEAMLSAPDAPFVAIGEVGIDLYWDASRRDEQVRVFERQIAWAEQHRLPLIIHSRAAHRLLVDTLLPHEPKLVGGIFHCFGGTADEARELLTKFPRFLLGIGGVVTFKKSTLRDVLREIVPLSRIVLETDCPYLAPTPHRGMRNEPSYLPLVVEVLSDVYSVTPEEIVRQTSLNAEQLLGV